jgi:hypothetical protein
VTPWLKIAGMAEAYNLPVVSHVIPEFYCQLIAAAPNGLTVASMQACRAQLPHKSCAEKLCDKPRVGTVAAVSLRARMDRVLDITLSTAQALNGRLDRPARNKRTVPSDLIPPDSSRVCNKVLPARLRRLGATSS